MSDYRAIQGVTTSIKSLLETHMFLNRAEVPPNDRVAVTVGLPDKESDEGRRVNLFLYQVVESPYLKNMDLPGATSPGAYGTPPLSLDLHYLVTAYGESDEGDQFEAQQILGDAMRTLHDRAYLNGSILDASLQGAFERAKITLMPLTLEDLTKIWTALSTPYRVSAGYKVTVVQIESRQQKSFPMPVAESPGGGPRIVVVPARMPRIQEIFVRRPGDAPDRERTPAYARIGDTLIVKGSGLGLRELRLFLGEADVTAAVVVRTDERLELTLPANTAISPGVIGVRAVADVMLGEPPVPHRGFSSNLGAFVLTPSVATLTPDLGASPRTLAISGTRLFEDNRECLTIVGDFVVHSSAYTSKAEGSIAFDLPAALGSGTHVVRVRVNGVESFDAPGLVVP